MTAKTVSGRARMSKIAVLGAGSWGTAVADFLAGAGREVTLWGRDPAVVAGITQAHRNPRYLRDIQLCESIKATTDLHQAVRGADIVAMAVSSGAVREVLVSAAPEVSPSAVIVSLTKGLESGTLKRMTQVIEEVIPGPPVAALSGPNHAEEVSRRIPSATVIAAQDEEVSRLLQRAFMTPEFRVYRNRDLLGVELAGAVKNVIALAAGISDGLGFGDNAKASLVTRGLAEMWRLGAALGAESRTFSGLAGMGDLVATCTSRHSRNRAVGERLAKGQDVESAQAELGMVAEGVRTTAALKELMERAGVDMPLSLSVYDVVYRGKDPLVCVADLMGRGPAEEE